MLTVFTVLADALKKTKTEYLLKAGVVPGVLEDFNVKGVLNCSSTARTVTSFCN